MREPKEKSMICKNFVIAWGPQKSPLAWPQQVDHDDVDTYGHFLSAINTDLIYSAFGSTIRHEPNEKSIICTRILSSQMSQSAADVPLHKLSSTVWLIQLHKLLYFIAVFLYFHTLTWHLRDPQLSMVAVLQQAQDILSHANLEG